MAQIETSVTGGVDTHKDNHVGAVVDHLGGELGSASFPATTAGYEQLLSWMNSFGQLTRVGVEGTGSYGAGLGIFLSAAGIDVLEINRPNRQLRRRKGKSDAVDALSAARTVLTGDGMTPKSHDGSIESIRNLRVVLESLRNSQTRYINQMKALVVSASQELREQLIHLNNKALVERCSAFRPGLLSDCTQGAKRALKALARQHESLQSELTEIRGSIKELTATANLGLISARGAGLDTASALLVVAGDNPQRLKSKASFAALCGVSPIDASSGKQSRHRLNRGGDRRANQALWRMAMGRIQRDPESVAYFEKKIAEGKTRKEAIRCLMRHIANEVFTLITQPVEVPKGTALRSDRTGLQISLAQVATALDVSLTRLSQIERCEFYDAQLADRYQHWLTSQIAA